MWALPSPLLGAVMRIVFTERIDLDLPGAVVPSLPPARRVFETREGSLVAGDEPPAGARAVWLISPVESEASATVTHPAFTAEVRYRWRVVDPLAVVRDPGQDHLEQCRAAVESLVRGLVAEGGGRSAIVDRLTSLLPGQEAILPGGLEIRVIDAVVVVRRPEPGGAPSGHVQGSPPGEYPGGSPPGEFLEQEIARPPKPDPLDQAARHLVALLPAAVPTGDQFGLQVRIVAAPPDRPPAASAPMRHFEPEPGGTEVTVVVHAESGLIADGPLLQSVRVPWDGDSDPLLFPFVAVAPGLHKVDVKAYAGGSFLAELRAEVSVGGRGRRLDGAPHRATIGDLAAVPGEVTLQVQADAAGRYVFQVLSDRTQFSPVTVTSLTGSAGPAVEQVLAALSRLARGGSDHTDANAREWLRQSGVNLWTQLVPAAVKEQFFEVRDAMSAFTVAAAHDVVPWELLYPLRPGRDDGFLIEQVPVVRRVFDQARSPRIGLSRPRFVVPEGSPADALDEVVAIGARLGAPGGPVTDELDELLRLIGAGGFGMAHFACHNNYRAEAGGSSIRLRNGSFLPVMLAAATVQRSLARDHPLIFINACRSAGEVPQYTEMMGWAKQFMAAGAGAFVGTLWDIRSRRAAAFADGFYQRLTDGRTLGEAAHETRVEAARDRADPTWLAYSVYGDPAATAAR
jgi:hypothetical protein